MSVLVVHRSDVSLARDRVAAIVAGLRGIGHTVASTDEFSPVTVGLVTRIAEAIDRADRVVLVDPVRWWPSRYETVIDLLRARIELCAANHVEQLALVWSEPKTRVVAPELVDLPSFELPTDSTALHAWLAGSPGWPEPPFVEPTRPNLDLGHRAAAKLAALISSASGDRGRLVWIRGGIGTGKTSLIQAWRRIDAQPGRRVEVWHVRSELAATLRPSAISLVADGPRVVVIDGLERLFDLDDRRVPETELRELADRLRAPLPAGLVVVVTSRLLAPGLLEREPDIDLDADEWAAEQQALVERMLVDAALLSARTEARSNPLVARALLDVGPTLPEQLPARFTAALEPTWARLRELWPATRRVIVAGLALVRVGFGPLPTRVLITALGPDAVTLLERHASAWLRAVPGHVALAHPWIAWFLAAEIDLADRDPHGELVEVLASLRATDRLDPASAAYFDAHAQRHRQVRRGLDENERRIGELARLRELVASGGSLEQELERALALVRPQHASLPRAMLAIATRQRGLIAQDPGRIGELFWRELVARGHAPAELDDWLIWDPRPTIRLRNQLARVDHSYRVLVGHTDEVTGCGISSDASLAITVGSDRRMCVWDPRAGIELRRLEFKGWGLTCALTPDGSRAVVGSETTLSIVDPHTLVVHATHSDHTATISTVAISSDGMRMLSGDRSGMVVSWDLASGERQQHPGHTGWINVCALSSDGALGASADGDEAIFVWALERGIRQVSLRYHKYSIGGLAFTSDNHRLISSGIDSVFVCDLATGAALNEFGDLGQTTAGIVLLAGDREVVVAESGKRSSRFTLDDGKLLSSHHAHAHGIECVAATPDGAWVLTGGGDRVARVWRRETTNELPVERYIIPVSSVIPGGSPDTAWVSDSSHGARLIALADGEVLGKLTSHSCANAMAVLGDRLYCAHNSGQLCVYSTQTFERLSEWKPGTESLSNIAIAPRERLLACSQLGTVILSDLDGTELRRFEHGERISTLEFDAHGQLFSSGADGRICVWDRNQDQPIRSFVWEKDRLINTFALQRIGSRIAIAGTGGPIDLLADSDGARVQQLRGHAAGVEDLVVHPSGRILASASGDATIRLWSLVDGRELACYRAGTPLNRVAFVGERLVAGDVLGNTMILDVDWGTISA